MSSATFIVFAYPRTGSYHLQSMLDSADDIICHGELFKKDTIELESSWHRDHAMTSDPKERDAAPIEYLTHLRNLNPHKVFGFKMFTEHARRVPELANLLSAPSWQKICLVRDPLEVYASILRAQKTGTWVVKEDIQVEDPLVEFTPDSYAVFMSSYMDFLGPASNILRTEQGILINYRDIGAELKRMLDFLGSTAEPSDLASEYRKQSSRSLPQSFSNWEKLLDHLSENPLPPLVTKLCGPTAHVPN